MAAPIPEINYPGIPLEEKFRWMQTGHGMEGIDPAVRTLATLAPEFEASADHINQALPDGMTWRGAAATAATGSLSHTAQRAQQAGQAGQLGGSLVGAYGTSFASAKERIAAPVEQNWFSRFTDYIGLTEDHAKIVTQNQALDNAANRALKAYEDQARHAVASFPDPNAPPRQAGGPAGATTPPGARVAPRGPGGVGAPAPRAPAGATPGPNAPGAAPPGSPATPPQPGVPGPTGQSPPVPPASAGPASRAPSTPPSGPDGWSELERRKPTSPPGLAPGLMPAPFPSPRGSTLRRPGSGTSGAPPTPLPERPSTTPRLAQEGSGWPASTPEPPTARPSSSGLMPPMPSRGGWGGHSHEHRNVTYIPSDDPFQPSQPDDVVPPVLGLGNTE